MSIDFKNLANIESTKWVDKNFNLINKDPTWKRIIKSALAMIGLYSYHHISAPKILETIDHKILDTFFDITPANLPTKSNLDEIANFLRVFDAATHGKHKEQIAKLKNKIDIFKYGSLPTMLFAKNTPTRADQPCEKIGQSIAILQSWFIFEKARGKDKNTLNLLSLLHGQNLFSLTNGDLPNSIDPQLTLDAFKNETSPYFAYTTLQGHIHFYEKVEGKSRKVIFDGKEIKISKGEEPPRKENDTHTIPSPDAIKQFLKHIYADAYPKESLIFECGELFIFINYIEELSPTPALKSWILGCLTHLQTKAVKLNVLEVQEAVKSEMAKYSNIASQVTKKVDDDSKVTKSYFFLNDRPTFVEASPGSIKTVNSIQTPPLPLFKGRSAEEVQAQLATWQTYIESLKQAGNMDILDRELILLMDAFQPYEYIEPLIATMEKTQVNVWTAQLKYFVSSLVSNHYRLQRHPFPAGHIKSVLNLLDLQLLSISKFDVKGDIYMGYFRGSLSTNLSDPYLSLGIHQKEIHEIHKRAYSYSSNEWNSIHNAIHNRYINNDSFIVTTAESFLYLKMVVSEDKYLWINKPDENQLDPATAETRNEALQNSIAVREKLKNFEGDLTIDWDDKIQSYRLQPLGLYFDDLLDRYPERFFKDQTDAAFSNYKEQGTPITGYELRNRVCESHLATVFITKYSGYNAPHDVLLDENFAFEDKSNALSYALQMAQTRSDRPRTTLILFSNYPTALNDPQLMRILMLNFTKVNGAYEYYAKNPEHVFEMVQQIYKLDQLQQKDAFPLEEWATFVCTVNEIISALVQEGKIQSNELTNCAERCLNALKDKCEHSFLANSLTKESLALIRHYLFAESQFPSRQRTQDDWTFIFKAYFAYSNSNAEQYAEDKVEIARLIDSYVPQMFEDCKNTPALVDEVISYCYKKKDQPRAWEFIDGFLIQSTELKLNLRLGEVAREAQVNYRIPKYFQHYLRGLVEPEFFKRKHQGTLVTSGSSTYISLKLEGVDIWLPFSNTQEIFIEITYTNPKGLTGKYSLFPQASSELENLSADVKNCPCYFSEDKKEILFLGPAGEVRYTASTQFTLLGLELTSLEQQFLPGLPKKVLQPDSKLKLDQILRISKMENLVFLGQQKAVQAIYDLKLKLTFIWNQNANTWNCQDFSGYSISSNPIEKYYKPINQYSLISTRQKPSIFHSEFDNYLVIEHAELPAKLVIPHNEYVRTGGKYSRKLTPLKSNNPVTKAHVLDIDAEKGLCSTNPNDYLYLSYLYFSQGRYVEANNALADGFLRLQSLNAEGREILSWISNWNDNSANAAALRLSVIFYSLQINDKGFQTIQSLTSADSLIINLLDCYEEYQQKLPKIYRQLQFPQTSIDNLRFYALRLGDLAYSKFLTPNDIEYISSISKEDPEKKAKFLQYALQQEIEALHQAVKNKPEEKKLTKEECYPAGINVFNHLIVKRWLKRGSATQVNKEPIENVVKELTDYFKDKNTYAKEIIHDNIEDIKIHLEEANTNTQWNFDTSKDLKELTRYFTDSKQLIEGQLTQLKQHIIAQFQLGIHESGTLLDLKEISLIAEDLFRKGKQAINESDWKKLLEIGTISKKQLPELKKAYIDYLKLRREQLQINKILKQVQKCTGKLPEAEEFILLGNLLTAQSPYNPDTFRYAHAMLLIEEELAIVLSTNQFIHIVEMINNPSSFKQEMWGAGKTTVIRNIIAKILADGYNLSGVLSDAALVTPHHKLLKDVSSNAYGDEAYLNTFSRDVKLDKVTILNEHRKVLKLIRDGGRMDQTLHTFVSMLHAKTLRLLQMNHNDKESISLVKSLEDLLGLYAERAVFGSDELDKVGNPSHYHNFGDGKVKLSSAIYEPAFTLMRHIKTDARFEPYRAYFSQKHTKDMNAQERSDFLQLLAQVASEHLKCTDLNTELLLKYLTGSYDENIITFFNTEITKHPKFEEIMRYHILIAQTIDTSFDRVPGVKYWRSEDGIHTKPTIYAGKCNEKGQNSSIELTVWDTCVDYMRQGIHPKALKAYINNIKAKCENELLENENDTLDTTPTGKEFLRRFDKKLSEVTPKDYPEIQSKLNNNLDWTIEFITNINFEEYFYSTGRIDGHAAYASHNVRELWGSSGNAESVRAMPNKVNRHPDMYRQKGAAGNVYATFIQEMNNPETPVETYDYSVPFEQYLAARLKPGSAFVDVAPFFEGLSNAAIAEKLSPHLPEGRKVRFQGEGDDVLLYDKNGNAEKDIGLVNLTTTNTVFPKKDTRGTNITLLSDQENTISISSDTDLTNLSQAIMRDRKYGKGSRFRYIQDTGLESNLGREDFKNLSRAARYMILFAEKEEQSQKKLNYILSSQEIAVTGICAIQKILKLTSNENYFEVLSLAKKINPEWFISPSERSLKKRAAPVRRQSGRAALENVAKKEARLLRRLQKKLTDATLQKTLEETIVILEANTLIQEEKYLLDNVKGSENDQNVVVIEVEADVTATQEAEIDQQDEQEISMINDNSADKEVSFEQDLRRGRPLGRFAHWHYNVAGLQHFAQGLCDNAAASIASRTRTGCSMGINYPVFLPFVAQFSVASEVYPNTTVTLGPDMDLAPSVSQYQNFARQNWLYGYTEKVQIFYPSMFLFANDNGDTGALLGHAGEADFAEHLKHRVTKQTATPLKKLVNYHFMSGIDIDQYDVPANCLDKFKIHVAMGKMIYGFAPLNEEEKVIITHWMNQQPNKAQLIQNFRDLCNRHCSTNQKVDLLDLFNVIA